MVRTDGDTWDIVSSVGVTALGVAAMRAMETLQPDPLIRDDYAALFVAASGHEPMSRLLEDPEPPQDSPLAFGLMGHRSKFYDDFFLDAAADGVRQAVILAAGLDARAYRLSWPTGTVVFELDQPKVLEFKQTVLDEHGAVPTADRRALAVDLRDDWPAALLAAGFDPAAPTAWSAEGLLPYLPGAAQDLLFERIERLSAPGSRLATDMVADPDGLIRMQDFSKEELQDTMWGDVDIRELFYTDDRADPDIWFAERGWTTGGLLPHELAARYDRPMPEVPEPFSAMMNSIRYVTAVRPR
ncbi:class I SAM-dependent methyltransferase [Nocardia terpenica]|uniref:class I SAM-dependent methyltransferase n=1 Tax=Nocardia terpenica TaxID=455432 RepID=UPI001893F764|nr:class I SAM-dependent methyltransferase [Nocardia terpenica]MBF6065499.1 class I SAM-dependent methyltransferase [Nocardia terpenica]MBF6108699.1 class I SAM-dependent methyltransferase [Nocardia terpenica]MBF6115729.1 class I SAM-dependent methyltransferase [Nocardia terpenica]MBF6122744.1 class I SAM-dependent methyltransferase [Nocardia terpenica]MBF6155904.1 class I SAM-dependent methyltransferase [Nocardia terpenica]